MDCDCCGKECGPSEFTTHELAKHLDDKRPDILLCEDCNEAYLSDCGIEPENWDNNALDLAEYEELEQWVKENGEPAPTPPRTIIHAVLDTRSFCFEVYTETEDEAKRLMEQLWARHAARTGAPMGWSELVDNVEYHEVTLGVGYRDREVL
jgi:hypothetical protein